jgi:hypothetical protein
MPNGITTWFDGDHLPISPVPRSDDVGVGHAVEALEDVFGGLRDPRPSSELPRGLVNARWAGAWVIQPGLPGVELDHNRRGR